MTDFEADLVWVDSDNAGMLELNSKLLTMYIEPLWDDKKFNWRLVVHADDPNLLHRKQTYAERPCTDIGHAWYLADAFEREAMRCAAKTSNSP